MFISYWCTTSRVRRRECLPNVTCDLVETRTASCSISRVGGWSQKNNQSWKLWPHFTYEDQWNFKPLEIRCQDELYHRQQEPCTALLIYSFYSNLQFNWSLAHLNSVIYWENIFTQTSGRMIESFATGNLTTWAVYL